MQKTAIRFIPPLPSLTLHPLPLTIKFYRKISSLNHAEQKNAALHKEKKLCLKKMQKKLFIVIKIILNKVDCILRKNGKPYFKI